MLHPFSPPKVMADIAPIITPRLSMTCAPKEQTRRAYREWIEPGAPPLHWNIRLLETNENIGNVGVISHDRKNRRCEIGYVLDSGFYKRGYMTEAVKAVCHFLLFDAGYNRVEARHSPENHASGAVLRRVGMVYEGLARQSRYKNGVFCDRLRYSLVFSDLFPMPATENVELFDDLSDGEIDVICERFYESPKETGYIPTYECSIKPHGRSEIAGYLRLSVGFSKTLYYGGHIGYRIEETHRGKYYAAKACTLIKPVAMRMGLSPIIITCNPENTPSWKTLLRIGAQCVRVVDVPPGNSIYLHGERRKMIFEWR